MKARGFRKLGLSQQVAHGIMDDKALGSLLAKVQHCHDPAKQLLLESEGGGVVVAAGILAPASGECRVELPGEFGQLCLGCFLRDNDHLLAQEVSFQQEDE